MAEVLIDVEIFFRGFFPTHVLAHPVSNEVMPLFGNLSITIERSLKSCIHLLWIRSFKGKAVALFLRFIGCIYIKHCIAKSSGHSRNRYRSIAQCNELGKSARLECGRNDEHVCARIDFMS